MAKQRTKSAKDIQRQADRIFRMYKKNPTRANERRAYKAAEISSTYQYNIVENNKRVREIYKAFDEAVKNKDDRRANRLARKGMQIKATRGQYMGLSNGLSNG